MQLICQYPKKQKQTKKTTQKMVGALFASEEVESQEVVGSPGFVGFVLLLWRGARDLRPGPAPTCFYNFSIRSLREFMSKVLQCFLNDETYFIGLML